MDGRLISMAAQARDALDSVGETHGVMEGVAPRYELFDAANSICSQKVRAVLAHHALPYLGHSLNIFLGETYLPAYVRLRMAGCARYGGGLASRHSGSTSTAAGGCDGTVVPTLIDWEADAVIVDSKRICMHLDDQVPPQKRLRPDHLAAIIDEDLAVVDNLPNYQMLMGRVVGDAEPETTRAGVGASLSRKKVAICDRYLADHGGDGTLAAAYTAKRAKELSAAEELFSPQAMRTAHVCAALALTDLDRKLKERKTRWLYADDLTMSDLFWGIELLRMKNIGFAGIWSEARLPHVEKFSAETERVAAIRKAVIEWPGAMF